MLTRQRLRTLVLYLTLVGVLTHMALMVGGFQDIPHLYIVTFLSAIDEGAQALVEDYVAAATFVSFFSDTVTAEDLSNVAALFWELIATQQIASWENIDDAQTPSWQTIGMTETSGWQDISSTQNSGWALIDTEQADAWQIIDTPTEV